MMSYKGRMGGTTLRTMHQIDIPPMVMAELTRSKLVRVSQPV